MREERTLRQGDALTMPAIERFASLWRHKRSDPQTWLTRLPAISRLRSRPHIPLDAPRLHRLFTRSAASGETRRALRLRSKT